MDIEFISKFDDVRVAIPLDTLKIVCVPKYKYKKVFLCIKDGLNFSFAEIKLFNTDRYIDAKRSFEAATALGYEIENAFNNRKRLKRKTNNGKK